MPLTRAEELSLFEIYNCPVPELAQVIVSGGSGTMLPPNYLPSGGTPVQEQLKQAIDVINRDVEKVKRVSEIIGEYRGFYTDLGASIDRDGYKATFKGYLNSVYRALMPYTGIIVNDHGGGGGVYSGRLRFG